MSVGRPGSREWEIEADLRLYDKHRVLRFNMPGQTQGYAPGCSDSTIRGILLNPTLIHPSSSGESVERSLKT